MPRRREAGSSAELDFGGTSEPGRLLRWAPADWPLDPSWRDTVEQFLDSPDGRKLSSFLQSRLDAGAVIYPPEPLRALAQMPLEAVRVLILGQDPYHGPGQAEGLAFSVPPGVRVPPSLRNILKELGQPPVGHGSLRRWSERGILLLNTCLTVEQGCPASHARQGWEQLTDALITRVAATASPCVYMLWGAHAQAKTDLIRDSAASHGCEALILTANHPSPLSAARGPAPFLGSGHFKRASEWLAERGVRIDFSLE